MTTPDRELPIVVGLDDSRVAAETAQWAASMADLLGARLRLLTALPDASYVVAEMATLGQVSVFADADKRAEATLSEVEERIAATHPNVQVATDTLPGPPGRALIDASRDARMLVVGSSGAGLVESTLIGSTTISVSGRASCPVAVWRGGSTVLDQRPIVVGIDFSRHSAAAAETAFELAASVGAPLIAVRAYSTRRPIGEVVVPNMVDWDAVNKEEHDKLTDSIAPLVERYPEVKVSQVVERHNPARLLLEHAEAAQLVVVGSRGRGRIVGGLFGSTSQNLLHRAACPMIIVHEQD